MKMKYRFDIAAFIARLSDRSINRLSPMV